MVYELRWNPVIKWWVMVASSRQKRPLLPKDQCPFCPSSDKVPEKYDVLMYPNDFPILCPDPSQPIKTYNNDLFKTAKSYGKCEVILYSSDHNKHFWQLEDKHLYKLVDLWTQRYIELSKLESVEYVFIFENRGEVVGVTINHPHGQIYAFPFIPKKIEIELNSCEEYFKQTNKCLHCQLMKEEAESGTRTVYENDSFYVFVPYFAEYPYQLWVISKKHRLDLTEFNQQEKHDLAKTLKIITQAYDNVFNFPFPYMMCFHQQPTDGKKYPYYHFHIEFYPPMRNEKTQKYNASSETGAWANGNPTSPEEKAAELRSLIKQI